MRAASSRGAVARAFVAAFLCLGIGACSAGNDSSSVIEQTPEAVDVTDPASPPECEVPQCVETGFLSDPDGFSFANWSDTGALDASSLVDMFGEEAVCIEGEADECLLSPSADQWLTQANSAMTVGHCEGMAALAQEIFQGTRPLDMYNPNAPFTFALRQSRPVVESIEQLWASQLLPDLQAETAKFRKMQPGEIAEWLSTSLQSGTTYTMGLYASPGVGHTVTPSAVRYSESGWEVRLYDNEFPGLEQTLRISDDGSRWEYQPRDSNGAAIGSGSSGGIGSIDLTPVEARAFPQTPPFAPARGESVDASPARLVHVLATSPGGGDAMDVRVEVSGKSWSADELMADPSSPVTHTPLRTDGDVGAGFATQWDPTQVTEIDFQMMFAPDQAASSAPRVVSWDVPGFPRIATEVDPSTNASVDVAVAGDGSVAVTSRQAAGDRLVLINNQLSVVLELETELRVILGAFDSKGNARVVLEPGDPDADAVEFTLPGSVGQDSGREFIVDAKDLASGISVRGADESVPDSALEDFRSRLAVIDESREEDERVDDSSPNGDSTQPTKQKPKKDQKPKAEARPDEETSAKPEAVVPEPEPEEIPEEPEDPGPPPDEQEPGSGENFPG